MTAERAQPPSPTAQGGAALSSEAAASLQAWHEMVATRDLSGLAAITHSDAVFRSPMAHTPYPSREAVIVALNGAMRVFENFTYHRAFVSEDGRSATLEFSAEVGGKALNGVDLVRFDEGGLIIEFEVMVRPMSGLAALGEAMSKEIDPIISALSGGASKA